MSFRIRHVAILGMTLALGTLACGSDITGPDGGNFDAETTAAGLATVDGAFETDAFASLEVLGDNFGIPGASAPAAVELLKAAAHPDTPDFSERISSAASELLATSAAPAVVLIPEEYRGLTLTYTGEGGYEVDEALTDAPANGIRFILYAVNPITREITEPLTEIGYADITDESTEAVASIGLAVVSGGVTYLDYLVTLSGTIVNPTFTIDGFITDGTDQADFTLTHAYAVNIAGITINIDYDIAVNDFSMDVSLEIVGGGDQSTTTTVDISFSDGSNTVTIAGSVEDEVGTLEVFTNSVLFATITIDGSAVTVVDGDGEPLTQEEITTLQELIEIIDEAGEIFEDLVRPVEFLFGDD
ncbi:hypothetical protein ACFL3B_05880 [Gemmatimonadota bacterium]